MPRPFEGGKRCNLPVSLVDIAPTVLSATAAEMDLGQASCGPTRRFQGMPMPAERLVGPVHTVSNFVNKS